MAGSKHVVEGTRNKLATDMLRETAADVRADEKLDGQLSNRVEAGGGLSNEYMDKFQQAKDLAKKMLGVDSLDVLTKSDADGWLMGGHFVIGEVNMFTVHAAKVYEMEGKKDPKDKYAIGYIVELHNKVVPDSQFPELGTFGEGQKVIIGERHAMKALRDLSPGAVIVMGLRERVDLGQGQSFLRFELNGGNKPGTPENVVTFRDQILEGLRGAKSGSKPVDVIDEMMLQG